MSDDLLDLELTDEELEDLALAEARIKAVHRLFKQDPDGAALLQDLVDGTIMKPIVQAGDSQFAAGIREGRAQVVRQILEQIKLAESM